MSTASVFRLFVILVSAAVLIQAGELRVGTAAVTITPAPGTPMGGGFTIGLSTGVHDELHCKAIAMEKDGERAAIVGCDVESLHRPTILKARELISATCATPPDNVMITATHSHSGPEMTPMVIDGASGEPGRQIREYHDRLPDWIAESVKQAEAILHPARVSTGVEFEDSISFNRRFLLRNGAVRMNPGQRNPDIVRAMGPIDPEVSVVLFEQPSGEALATQVNFALHTTVWGQRDFSSDYPGVVSNLLASVKGEQMLTLFTNGAAGNINQIDTASDHQAFGPAETRRVGTILAGAVMRAYKSLAPVDDGPLRVSREVVHLPVPSFAPSEVDAAREIVRRSTGGEKIKFLTLVHANRVLNVAERHGGKPIETEVQVISLGNQLAWVGFPGELFVELGIAVKSASPFRHTVVNELANDMLDYFPDRKAYGEGGYEVTTARCSQGCGEFLVETALRLLTRAHEASSPYRPEGANQRLQAKTPN
jgi:hypothetical protein